MDSGTSGWYQNVLTYSIWFFLITGGILLDPTYIDANQEGSNTLGVFTSESTKQFSSLSAMLGGLASSPSFVLVPEQEISPLISGLLSTDITDILNYIYSGGTLVYTSMGDSNALSTQKLFGWNISGESCSENSTSIDAGQAYGTSFEGGPTTLPPLNAVKCVSVASLPAGSLPIYFNGSAVSVFLTALGAGRVIGLAPDWSESSSEWNSVLMRAVHSGQSGQGCAGGCKPGTFSIESGPVRGYGKAPDGRVA